MANKTLPIINILTTLTTLYLFKVYGSLAKWWSNLCNKTSELQVNKSTFYTVADSIHIIVIILLIMNFISAIKMCDGVLVSRPISIIATICAGLGLGLCLLIAF